MGRLEHLREMLDFTGFARKANIFPIRVIAGRQCFSFGIAEGKPGNSLGLFVVAAQDGFTPRHTVDIDLEIDKLLIEDGCYFWPRHPRLHLAAPSAPRGAEVQEHQSI